MQLAATVQDSLDDLRAAESAIANPALGSVLKRVRLDFQDRIQAVRKDLEGHARTAGRNGGSADDWTSFEADRADCSRLVRECLAFVQGALMRANQVDGGLCSAADALLRELNEAAKLGWKSFALPADGESFSDLAGIVRLRFPDTGVWDLPIVAHEFGHFVAGRRPPEKLTGPPFRFPAFADWHSQQNRALQNVGEELFADAFGTFALGPAFARTCLLRRFAPASAERESDGVHPSFARRAYLIARMLSRMEGEIATLGESLEKNWNDTVALAGKAPLPDEKRKELHDAARSFWLMLTEEYDRARYKTWASARSLSARLDQNNALEKTNSYADLLNAAWIARVRNEPGASSTVVSGRVMVILERALAERRDSDG